jgi:asparaginyl-tRNA synthetase
MPAPFHRERFSALIDIRATALDATRRFLSVHKYTEITVASLVNLAGSCENPFASFTLPYYGREAHLSQSAQLQLEALVIRLRRGVYTVGSSFRAEHFDDPETAGRRLSEFTLIEPEGCFKAADPEANLAALAEVVEALVREVTRHVLEVNERQLTLLRGDPRPLAAAIEAPFIQMSYDEAIRLLNRRRGFQVAFGQDFGMAAERELLRACERPVFLTRFPSAIKFFNMKRTEDHARVHSLDLLLPPLGEAVGGAVREEDGDVIARQLEESKTGEYLRVRNQTPRTAFAEYFSLFDVEPQVHRGGFGLGFERFIGFLLNSTDILETIAYRTLRP